MEVERELARFVAAVGEIGHSKVLLEAIQVKEQELDRISATLHASAAPKVKLNSANFRDFVVGRLRDLVGLFRSDVALARAQLAKHVREIRMVPAKDMNNQESYFAEGEWNVLGGLDFALVAGEGFEPSTFGL